MVGPIMNLISGTHYSCERREHAFMVLWEYTIISPYHFLTHPKSISIFVVGISWKITQVKQMLTCLTFVRSEEDGPLGPLPSNLSLPDHLLWGLSNYFLLLRCIFVNKWGLRPNIKVQAFAPTDTISNL